MDAKKKTGPDQKKLARDENGGKSGDLDRGFVHTDAQLAT